MPDQEPQHRTLDNVLSSADTPSRPEHVNDPTHREEPQRLARRADVAAALRQAPYPATRDDLARYLDEHVAPSPMIEALYALPAGRVYPDAQALAADLANPTRPDEEGHATGEISGEVTNEG